MPAGGLGLANPNPKPGQAEQQCPLPRPHCNGTELLVRLVPYTHARLQAPPNEIMKLALSLCLHMVALGIVLHWAM